MPDDPRHAKSDAKFATAQTTCMERSALVSIRWCGELVQLASWQENQVGLLSFCQREKVIQSDTCEKCSNRDFYVHIHRDCELGELKRSKLQRPKTG